MKQTAILVLLPVLVWTSVSGASSTPMPDGAANSSLPCEDLQRCLNRESRVCWKRFHAEGRKKDDLVGDVLKACPENDFLDFVDRTEAELWPEFMQVDKNLTDCMTESGFRLYVDFCGNMRSVNYSDVIEKTVDSAKKEQAKPESKRSRRDVKKPTEDNDRCWINALKTCVNQYPAPNENVNDALGECETQKHIAENEERLGFEVGKRVMLKIVTKIKEAFDKEDGGDDDIGDDKNSTKKATSKPAVSKARP